MTSYVPTIGYWLKIFSVFIVAGIIIYFIEKWFQCQEWKEAALNRMEKRLGRSSGKMRK